MSKASQQLKYKFEQLDAIVHRGFTFKDHYRRTVEALYLKVKETLASHDEDAISQLNKKIEIDGQNVRVGAGVF